MATGTFSREPTPPPAAYDQAVEQHLRATQTQVKLVDIASNSLLLVVGALAFTLAVAWVDHWMFALGFWTRLLALFVLLGGSGWWFAVRILPLIIKRINPVYAAQTIEQAEPSLKNSLINFLLLRNEREKVHAVVYQAVGQRAANDLSHVPAENVVDYSHLLKIGYVLAALLVVGAIYKIVSPKDPFQSAARIVAPWADIDRPSRVTIEDVTPGDVTIFQGEQVEISAQIKGASDDDVRVVFSTLDGQFIDQQAPMQLEETGSRHIAKIPGDDYGAQTSLQYRIVAGDAQTRWHNVEVVPAPHILVTKVEYTPPRYTGREKHSDTRGDIEGLEGTLVTVHARANRAIESATLEFDPLPDGVTAEARAASGSESYSIRKIDGENLWTSFYLRRTADGKSAWHQQYTIRFKTADGYRNQKPIVHSIDVKPDVAPIVEILSPKETTATVPLNRKLEIEVRAIDPDFALTNVRLVGIKGGSDLLDVTLLNATSGHDKQLMRKFEFAPAAYGLAVGDEVEYWAVAEDNRRAVKSDTPEPNITRSTPSYRIKITDPIAGAEPPMADETDDSADGGGAESESSSGGSPDEGNNGGGEGESGSEGDESSEDASADGMNSESSESGSGNSGTNSGQSGSESSEEGGDSSFNRDPAGSASDESGSSGGSQESQSGTSSASESGNRSDSSQQGGESGGRRDEPIENDGSRDGDIFDAINEHRQQKEQGGGESQNGNAEDLRDRDLSSDNQNGSQNNDQSFNRDGAPPSGGPGSASDDSNSGGTAQQDQGNQDNNQGGSSPSGGANQQDQNQNRSGTGNQSSGGANNSQQPQNGSTQGQENSGGASSEQQQGNDQSGGSDSQQNQGGANDQQQNKDAGGSNSEGGQPQGGAKPEGEEPQGTGGGEQEQNGGGMGQNDKSGAGQKNDGGGSPQSQADDQQRNKDKSGGAQQGGQQQQDGGKSPGGSKKDSDSQGGSGGDRKGGGEQGGGQSSKQQGQDSAGSSSSGEQGDGAAQEQGAGQSGNRAGGDQIANNPTGNSGEQAGEGSNTGNASGGERNDDQPRQGERNSGDPSRSGSQSGGGSPQDPNANPPESRGDRVTNSSGDGRGTLPTGGGKPADNHRSDIPLRDEEPGSDKANLEYARKATDLTLEYLKDQKDSPDPELLDKLGWTKDEMNSFIQRWERMKRSAKSAGDASDEARRLDDSLRSLGLRPPRGAAQTSAAGGTRLSAQRDGGSRSRPPKEYADQYRAFSKFVKPAGE